MEQIPQPRFAALKKHFAAATGRSLHVAFLAVALTPVGCSVISVVRKDADKTARAQVDESRPESVPNERRVDWLYVIPKQHTETVELSDEEKEELRRLRDSHEDHTP